MARGADQHKNPQSDIQIAQAATMRPIGEIADKLGIPDEALSPYGRYKAKVDLDRRQDLLVHVQVTPKGFSERLILAAGYAQTAAAGHVTDEASNSVAARTTSSLSIMLWTLRLCLRLRISAARSPIITQGAMVFAVVMRGMIDPSAMRRFSTP